VSSSIAPTHSTSIRSGPCEVATIAIAAADRTPQPEMLQCIR
jgi:hypothetical protein